MNRKQLLLTNRTRFTARLKQLLLHDIAKLIAILKKRIVQMESPDFENEYRNIIRRFLNTENAYYYDINKLDKDFLVQLTNLTDSHKSKMKRLNKEFSAQQNNFTDSHKSKMDRFNKEFSAEESRLNDSRNKGLQDLNARKNGELSDLNNETSGLRKKAIESMNLSNKLLSEAENKLAKVGLSDLLSTTTPAESFSSDADDSLDSVMTAISKTSDLVDKEAKEVLEEINRLVLFRNRRTKIRRTVFAAFVAIFVVLIFIGPTVYNQYLIFQGYNSARDAFEHGQWAEVHKGIEQLERKRFFRRLALPLFFVTGSYQSTFQLLGVADWNKTDFQFDMLGREAYYLSGVAAYIEKNWTKAIDEFRAMEKADKAFLSKYPVYYYTKPQASKENKKYREQYANQMREYQERRGLKEYFVDITPLLSDSLSYAGKDAFKEGKWETAITSFEQLPGDERYDKLIQECNYNLGNEYLKNNKRKKAYNYFRKSVEFKNSKNILLEILAMNKIKIPINNYGYEKNVKNPNTKMKLTQVSFENYASNKIALRFTCRVEITKGNKATILSPKSVYISSHSGQIPASKWGDAFSGKRKIKEFKFRAKNYPVGWIEFKNIPCKDIEINNKLQLHYGKYYTIPFNISLPKTL